MVLSHTPSPSFVSPNNVVKVGEDNWADGGGVTFAVCKQLPELEPQEK
jgi:hypothetical protein